MGFFPLKQVHIFFIWLTSLKILDTPQFAWVLTKFIQNYLEAFYIVPLSPLKF